MNSLVGYNRFMSKKTPPSLDDWLREIRAGCPPESLGMILFHSGVVRATSKQGRPVEGMTLSYDPAALRRALLRFRRREGVAAIRAWINQGALAVGGDIMRLCVAGRFRSDVLPAFQELLALIKNDIVREEEQGRKRKRTSPSAE